MARVPVRRARRSAATAVAGVVLLAGGLAACGGTSPITASPTPPSVVPGTTPGTPASTMPTVTSPTTVPSPSTTVPPTTPSTTVPPFDAATVLHRALANAHAAGWVTSESANSAGSEAIDTVAGPDRGLQTVTIGSDTGHIVVLPGATYIHGSASALVTVFSLPSAQAKALANHWVKLLPSDKEYANPTVGVTLPSLLAPLALTGRLQASTATDSSSGTRFDVVTGDVPKGTGYGNGNDTGKLAVTIGSHPLPAVLVVTTPKGEIEWEFRDWGKKATVSAPSGAVTLPH